MKVAGILRFAVWFVCIYCIGFGVLLNGPESWVSFVAKGMINCELDLTPPLRFTGRMLGVYMAFFGVALGLVGWNPQKNRAILSIGVVLLVLRILQRIVFAGQLETIFGITPGRNWAYIAITGVFAVMLLAYRVMLVQEKVSTGE